MQHPDEGTIHTWLDGELKADEAAAVEAHVAECGDCAARAADARGLVAASSRIVSSLDIVPADVIPVRRPIKRAWYANTQLRAAAAVLIVAGASFLVLRQEGELSPGAPSRAALLKSQPSLEPQSPQAAAAASLKEKARSEESDKRNQIALQAAGATAADESREGSGLRGKVSGVAVSPLSGRVPNAAPAATTTSRIPVTSAAKHGVVADAMSSAAPGRIDSSSARAETAMSNVVITGVAAASANSAASGLRVVKSDTTENTVVTVYAVAPDVEVTLRETARSAFALPGRETARVMTQSGSASPAPPNEVARRARLESITWTNYSTGRTYILSGALSKDELTSIRSRLPSGVR